MNFIDLILIVILLWSAYRGFTKGFILQLSTLAALLLGILGAIEFSDVTAGMLERNFHISPNYINVIAFAVTFIIIVVAIHLLAMFIQKLIHAIALGFIDRIVGIVFGIAKTAFILSIILVLVNKANDKYNFIPREKTNNSYLYQPLSDFAPMIFPYLRFEDLRDDLDQDREKKKKDEADGKMA